MNEPFYGFITKHDDSDPLTLNDHSIMSKAIWIGIGCKRDTSAQVIEQLVIEILDKFYISIFDIEAIATIDLKKNESGLLEFAEKYSLKIVFYTENELNGVKGKFSSSDFVKSITGVDSVCERAAVLGSNNGRLLCKKTAKNGVTVALACKCIK